MPAIITEQIRRHQPSGVLGIDWENPITRGLVFCSLPHTRFDSVSRKALSLVSAPTVVPGKGGLGFNTNGSSNYGFLAVSPLALVNFTMFSVIESTQSGLSLWAMSIGSTTNANTIGTIASGNSTATKLRVWCRDDGNVQPGSIDSNAVVHDGNVHIVHMVLGVDDAGTNYYTCYVDGAFDSKTAMGVTSTFTIDRIAIGCLLRSSAGSFWSGKQHLAGLANRAFTNEEVALHASQYYQLFAQRRQRIYAMPSSGAGGFFARDYYDMIGKAA